MTAPKHVAVIMDGNGRWAQQRLMPRIEGHRRGISALRTLLKEEQPAIKVLVNKCFIV